MSEKEPAEENFAALFEASEVGGGQRGQLAVGDVVRGRVIAVGASSAFVALGGKVEATIDLGEFRNQETGEVALAIGDALEATVVDDGSRSGTVVLKRVLGRGGHLSAEIEQAHAHRIPIEGLVSGEVKGGYEV